jgi:hypothetical protein
MTMNAIREVQYSSEHILAVDSFHIYTSAINAKKKFFLFFTNGTPSEAYAYMVMNMLKKRKD